jgi:hypothetical protein
MLFKKMSFKKQIITTGAAMMSVASMSLYAEGSHPEVEVSGAVEVEFGMNTLDMKAGAPSEKSSGAALATVELGFDAKINDKVSGHVLFLFEEGDTPLDVDEGTITIGDEEKISVTVGQMYVPFGAFETNVVSDPLTLEIGETRESAIMVTAKSGDISASLYLFNGNTIETSSTDDTLEHSGVSLSYSKDGLDVGLDYISSLGDSDTFQAALDNGTGIAPVTSFVAGLSIHAMYTMGDFNVIVEQVSAQDKFTELGDLEPSATNIDFGYSLGDYSLGLSLQSTDDMQGLGIPESKTLLSYSRELYEGTGLAVEYATSDYYDIDAEDSETTITVQLAVEF